VRDAIDAFIGQLYFGSVVPRDPNITVVLGKAQETSDSDRRGSAAQGAKLGDGTGHELPDTPRQRQ
jgi:hypothetical protein